MKGIAGFYYVFVVESGICQYEGKGQIKGKLYECRAKGIFRKDKKKPLVGDLVEIDILSEEKREGNITAIYPRKSEMIRPSVANVDQVLLIFALEDPKPRLSLLDRFLLSMGVKGLPVIICFNKRDLASEADIKRYREIYERCGYKVIFISTKKDGDKELISSLLKGKISAVAGPSGVGKSSLTNFLQENVEMETGGISKKLGRGRHTTRHSQIIPLAMENTYIMDTPGFSSFWVEEIEKEDLQNYFPEFRAYQGQCRFLGCMHRKEPSCAVKEAVERGEISKERYENYCLFYEEIEEKRRY